MRARLADWRKRIDAAGGPSAKTLIAPSSQAPDERVVAETEKLLTIAYLLGRDHAARPLDLAESYDAIPFEQAIAFMKSRVSMTKDEWSDLEPRLRFRAFTVAALADPDAIEKVRRSALASMNEGKAVGEFWTEAMAEEAAQLSGKNPGYWENVFRTNTQTAYNTGRAAEFSSTNPEYLEFIGIEDTRQTDICADRSGVILPATHPFWSSNWPPLHFQCRSTVRAIYREEAEFLRGQNPDWKPTDAGEIDGMPGAAKGFGGNPIDTGSFWMLTPKMVERAERYGIIDDIKAFAKTVGMKYDPIMASRMAAEGRVVVGKSVIPGEKEERAALRKEVGEKLEALRGSSVDNATLGESIAITRTGIKKALTFSGDPAKLAALVELPDMLSRVTIISTETEKRGNPDFTEVLKGRVAIEHAGIKHLFEVVMKRRKQDGVLEFYEILPYRAK